MATSKNPSVLYFLAAFAAGCIMASMTHLNATVALYGNAMFASWVGHGAGTIAAIAILIVLYFRKGGRSIGVEITTMRAPWWAYLGGVSGAATVVCASLAVNSPLALSGAIALGLGGQVLFSLAADHWGLFGLPSRRLDKRDFLSVVLILCGSLALIGSGGGS